MREAVRRKKGLTDEVCAARNLFDEHGRQPLATQTLVDAQEVDFHRPDITVRHPGSTFPTH